MKTLKGTCYFLYLNGINVIREMFEGDFELTESYLMIFWITFRLFSLTFPKFPQIIIHSNLKV